MSRRKRWMAGLALMPFAASAFGDGDKVKRDLFAVIALQGKPCGQVLSAERRGEDDYLVTCQSGDRYRVYVGEGDRVKVEKQ